MKAYAAGCGGEGDALSPGQIFIAAVLYGVAGAAWLALLNERWRGNDQNVLVDEDRETRSVLAIPSYKQTKIYKH